RCVFRVAFSGVALGAKCLKIVEAVAPAAGDGGDVVDLQMDFGVGGGRAAAGGAAVVVALEDFPAGGEGDFAACALFLRGRLCTREESECSTEERAASLSDGRWHVWFPPESRSFDRARTCGPP